MYSLYTTASWQNPIGTYCTGGFRQLSVKHIAYVWTFPSGNFCIIAVLPFSEISAVGRYPGTVYIADWHCYADNMDRRMVQ